jgi:hypothetical protein
MVGMCHSAGRALKAGVLAACAVASGPAAAGDVAARYAITLAGLSIGTATLSGEITDQSYSLRMQAHMTGLAGAVTSGKGAAQVSGSFAGARPISSGYALSASNMEVTRTIQMAMSGGSIGSVVINPPFEVHPDRVPVTEQHRHNVTDPVSALVMPALGRDDVMSPAQCNRTIAVFDGVQRFNVTLTSAGVQQITDGRTGYVGPALVCNARYQAIAGHRPDRPATRYMQNNREMSVWLVPVQGARALVPWRISVKTMVGTVLLEARSAAGLASEATASIGGATLRR